MATETDARHRLTEPGSMRIGLFIPCYVDMLFPEVGIATLELLERLGLEVGYPLGQTCCGQPMSNSGDEVNAAAAERLFVQNFHGSDPERRAIPAERRLHATFGSNNRIRLRLCCAKHSTLLARC